MGASSSKKRAGQERAQGTSSKSAPRGARGTTRPRAVKPGAEAANKYDQPGAPWWKRFLSSST